MQRRQFKMYIIFTIMFITSAKGYETNLMMAIKHKISKREDAVNKYQREPSKTFGYTGKLYPVKTMPETAQNISRSIDVKTAEGRSRALKINPLQRSFHGYLQLVPLNQYGRNYNSRHQKLVPRDGRSRMRYYNSRPRMQRSRVHGDLIGGASKWHLTDSSDRKFPSRYSSHRAQTYHNYPPFWPSNSNQQKFGSFQRFQKPKAISQHFSNSNAVAFLEKECNACNSVPWTPILKPSAVHDAFDNSQSHGVPTIEVHHDLHAYSSNQQQTISSSSPASTHTIGNTVDSTIPDSYGLPLGNIPTAHGLLPPINPMKVKTPQTILNSSPADGYLKPIPFPELSPVPVVPIHSPNQFVQVNVDTQDLVPPVPPQKSSSNVIFTISEQGPYQNDPFLKNHIGHAASSQNNFPVGDGDLNSEPSSLIDTRLLSHVQGHRFNKFNANPNNHNLDIVKSVPVAEFTSSIEYPLHFIQSPPYIDITTYSNVTNVESTTYEKVPQTGKHKISDILLGLVKDSNSKKSPSASADVESFRNVTPYNSGKGISVSLPKKLHSNDNNQDNYLSIFGRPFGEEQKHNFTVNEEFLDNSKSQTNLKENDKSINTDILNPPPVPPSFIWSDSQDAQISKGNPFSYFVDSSQQQQKPDAGANGEIFTESTSTSWLIPAQSNEAPQWILPVSNPPAIPYPLLSEEGIASVVNGELSLKPSQPTSNLKTKKVQIIIPYTTGENKDHDQQILETVESNLYKTTLPENSTLISVTKPASLNFSAALTGMSNKHEQVISGTETYFGIAELSADGNNSHRSKYLNDVHHILALNIKELLKDEVERPKSEQNIRLQKNIDDWTALEYSNHKTIPKKEPQDVISYANAVTSIPGTSISHLLLNSKKIPEKYLTTTPMTEFDEPETTQFISKKVSVASKPFTTKPYDTSGLYSTVTRIIPTATHKANTKLNKNINGDHPNKNHRHGYTEVKKMKANQWAKLTENLIVPENVSNKSINSTTASWSDNRLAISAANEEVYVVTPISVWQTSSSDEVSKRTTRQVVVTDRPTINDSSSSTESAKTHVSKLFRDKTQRVKISKFNKPKLIQKFFASTKPPPRNLTKIAIKNTEAQKNSHTIFESVIELNETETKSINDIFPFRNGGELPLELTITTNSTETNFKTYDKRKDIKSFNLSDSNDTKTEHNLDQIIVDESSTADVSASIDSETNVQFSRLQNTTKKGNNSSATEYDPKISANNTIINSSKELNNSTGSSLADRPEALPILPAGIYGETKKIRLASEDNDSTPDLSSLNDTIKLLKEYLKYASDELPSEKTDATINLKEKNQS